ncbi:hypothetical protein PCE1_000423 [Barthelona sp. PCE]
MWFKGSILFLLVTFLAVSHAYKLRFIQMTDLHGWIYGHSRQPRVFNATIADIVAFQHEWCRTDEKPHLPECITFDSGDLIEGTGLSDSTEPGGTYIFQFSEHLNFTANTIGNHDVFSTESAKWLEAHLSLFPNYVTTNFYTVSTDRTFGRRYRMHTTESGFRVLFFGFIYNYDNVDRTSYYIRDAVEVMNDDDIVQLLSDGQFDMIISLCHIGTDSPLVKGIVSKIREFTLKPIIMATGHTHRFRHSDCIDVDGNSVENCTVIEAGRYMEHLALYELDFEADVNGVYHWVSKPELIGGLEQKLTTDFLGNLVGKSDIRQDWHWRAERLMGLVDDALEEQHIFREVGYLPKRYFAKEYFTEDDSVSYFWLQKVFPYSIKPMISYTEGNDEYVFFFNTLDARADLYKGMNTYDDLYSSFCFDIPLWNIFTLNGLTPQEVYYAVEKKEWKDVIPLPEKNPHYAPSTWYSDMDPGKHYTIAAAQYNMNRFVRNLDAKFPDRTFSPNNTHYRMFYAFYDTVHSYHNPPKPFPWYTIYVAIGIVVVIAIVGLVMLKPKSKREIFTYARIEEHL